VEGAVPTLSVMWALEDSDQIRLSGDLLDAPAPTIMQPLRRQSLARLIREKAIRTREQQPYDASQQTDGRSRMRSRNKASLHGAKAHADNGSEVTETTFEPSMPLRMASTTSCLPVIVKQSVATNVGQPANIDASAPFQQPRAISKMIFAGAPSLGLCRNRNRSTSASLAHHSNFPTSTNLKSEVPADERSTKAKLQQCLKESSNVPRAPSKPPPDGSRKRPQIRGVPVLVMCAN